MTSHSYILPLQYFWAMPSCFRHAVVLLPVIVLY